MSDQCFPCSAGHPDDYECWNFWIEDADGFLVDGPGEPYAEPFTEVLCECEVCQPARFAAAHSDAPAPTSNGAHGPESPPVAGPARTVEVSDRTGRTDPDVP